MRVGIDTPLGVSNGAVRLPATLGHGRMAVIRTTLLHDEHGNVEGAVDTVKDVGKQVLPWVGSVVAESEPMRDVMSFVKRIAASEATTILIEGENGTGKDLLAKTIHCSSMRQAGPFVAINCAAIPETLLESELFGFEKGAFTDARAQKRGLVEMADKGTLFLDEIGEIPRMLQAKLLRLLEDQTFRRLGGLQEVQVDVRVIAATNRDLKEAVKEGAFRQDLYFRLNVIHFLIPALRERSGDILPLARFFVRRFNDRFKKSIAGITPEAEQLLLRHDWPGNVREVRNAIERAMILEDTAMITPGSLPTSLGLKTETLPPTREESFPDGGVSLQESEKALLIRALNKTNGNQTRAARLLGITRDTLRYKMKTFHLR